MVNKVCSIEGCKGKPPIIKTWCHRHWERVRKYGNPYFTKMNRGSGDTKEEKFWSKIENYNVEGVCWEWKGSCDRNGYGSFTYNYKYWSAHKFAWFLTYNKIPTRFLLHSCDNSKCCNPKHLREGTYQDNYDDMVKRNRAPKRNKPNLTWEQVNKIREKLSENKLTQTEIGNLFSVSAQTVGLIKNNKIWRT